MNKLVIIFMFLSMSLGLMASEFKITYADFIHFNSDQKIQTIKMVHQFLTHYEKLSIEERAKKQNQKKYTEYRKILNFFINSAYANDENFTLANIQDESLKAQLCYYAGWISIYKDGVCSHPAEIDIKALNPTSKKLEKLAESIKKNYKAATDLSDKHSKLTYNTEEKDGTTGNKIGIIDSFELKDETCNPKKESILCNPVIYGLHNDKAICVDGNKSLGVNSSLLCERAIDSIEKNEGEVPYREHMNKIVDNYSSETKKNEFFYTLKAMYDTCLCSAKSSTSASVISFDYAQKLFNSRTCLSIINQTQHINTALLGSITCEKDRGYNQKEKIGVEGFHGFLNKAAETIQKQEINDELEKFIKDKKFSFVIDSKANEASKSELTNIRSAQYEEYKRAGLCRYGEADEEEKDNKDKNSDGYTLTIVLGDKQTEGTKYIVATLTKDDQAIEDNELIKSITLSGSIIESEDGAEVGEIEDKIVKKNQKNFYASQVANDYNVVATVKIGEDIVTSGPVVVEGTSEDEEEASEIVAGSTCKIELKLKTAKDKQSYQIETFIEIDGEKLEIEDNKAPKGFLLSWFDNSPKPKTLTKTKQRKKYANLGEDAEDEAKKKDKKTEEDDKNLTEEEKALKSEQKKLAKKLEKIKKEMAPINKAKNALALKDLRPNLTDRVITAILKVGEEESECEATSSVTIPKGPDPSQSNMSPVQLPPGLRMQESGQGGIIQGVR